MFGQIRRPRSECTDSMYCKISLPTLQLWHTPSRSFPPGVSEHSAVPSSYGVHLCTPFTIEMVRSKDLGSDWSSMTDKRWRIIGCKIWCRWAPIYGSVHTLSDTNGGFAGVLARWYLSWWVKVFPLSLSHWCSFNSRTTDNHKILLQFNLQKLYKIFTIFIWNWKKIYTYWSIQSYTFFQFKCRFNKKIEIIFNL